MKYTLDTPVLIRIMGCGIQIPELNTYTPVKSYASLEQVISIMNRGIEVEFPNQKNNEINEAIEHILLDYREKCEIAKKKKGYIGTDMSEAINLIQDINDSVHIERINGRVKENDPFSYNERVKEIVEGLVEDEFKQMRTDQFFDNSNKRIDPDVAIKQKEILDNQKKRVREYARLEAEAIKRAMDYEMGINPNAPIEENLDFS